METKTDPKLYHLQSELCDFYAGRLTDGTQVFMTTDYTKLIAVLFDTEGRYLKSLIREFSQERQAALNAAIMGEDTSGFGQYWDEVDKWAAELGFTEGTIAVRKFCLPEFELFIKDLPGNYQELLDSGAELDEETKEWLRYWQEETDYVLVWGREYHINKEGEVVFT